MPHDEEETSSSANDAPVRRPSQTTVSKRSIFDIPAPLRALFDHFPLVTYEANELPLRAPRDRRQHVLHVFTALGDGAKGRPSCNPGCLKWQTYLHMAGLDFIEVSSSNHASPSGILPFLQPAAGDVRGANPDPIPHNKLRKWLGSQGAEYVIPEPDDIRYETYESLVADRVRKAWLFQLYLSPQNRALVHRLYVAPCSSQPFVQLAIASQLRAAAETELIKTVGGNVVSASDIIQEAEEAFQALSTLLGAEDWFFNSKKPSLFDASVFAYTHLILHETLGWKFCPLREALEKHENLVRHRKRISRLYYERSA